MMINMSTVITIEEHNKLMRILEDLIETIKRMQVTYENNYFLKKNLREVEEWKKYLCNHTDKKEVLSLQKEVADRFFYEFSNLVDHSEADVKRFTLIQDFMNEAWKYVSE